MNRHDRHLCKRVRELIADSIADADSSNGESVFEFYLSRPSRCQCGAVVRFIGDCGNGNHDGWLCPHCGAEYPYVFWKLPREQGPVRLTGHELIVRVAETAPPAQG